jgi:DNA-binding FadR family transcriptional regulator
MRQLIEDTARETFGDMLDARLILEVASAERAAQKATLDDIAKLTEALEGLRAAPPRSAQANEAHAAFHRAVARASHNLFLFHMVDSLLDVQVEHVPSGNDDSSSMALLPLGYEAHARIFRPIRDRRVALAHRAMFEHLSNTIQHHPNLHH